MTKTYQINWPLQMSLVSGTNLSPVSKILVEKTAREISGTETAHPLI